MLGCHTRPVKVHVHGKKELVKKMVYWHLFISILFFFFVLFTLYLFLSILFFLFSFIFFVFISINTVFFLFCFICIYFYQYWFFFCCVFFVFIYINNVSCNILSYHCSFDLFKCWKMNKLSYISCARLRYQKSIDCNKYIENIKKLII